MLARSRWRQWRPSCNCWALWRVRAERQPCGVAEPGRHLYAVNLLQEHQRLGQTGRAWPGSGRVCPGAVCLCQPQARPHQDSGLGCQRVLAAAQAPGEGPLHLAARRARRRHAQRGATALAAQRHRPPGPARPPGGELSARGVRGDKCWPERCAARPGISRNFFRRRFIKALCLTRLLPKNWTP